MSLSSIAIAATPSVAEISSSLRKLYQAKGASGALLSWSIIVAENGSFPRLRRPANEIGSQKQLLHVDSIGELA
jgi:hypothetical protein